jgi:hypothetical protein
MSANDPKRTFSATLPARTLESRPFVECVDPRGCPRRPRHPHSVGPGAPGGPSGAGAPSGPSGAWGLGPGAPGGPSGAGAPSGPFGASGLGPGAAGGLSGAWGLGDPVSSFFTFGSRVPAGPAGLGSAFGGDFGDIGSLAGAGVSELLTVGQLSR